MLMAPIPDVCRLAPATPPARLARLGRKLATSATGTAIGILAQIVAIPFQLGALGAERFGLLALFLAVVAAGSIIDTGIGPAILRFTAKAAGRRRLLEQVIASSLTAVLAVGAAVAALAHLGAWRFAPELAVAGIAPASMASLAALGLTLGMVNNLALNVLRGLRRHVYLTACDSGYKILLPLVMTAAAMFTGNLDAVLAAYCAVAGVMAVISLVLVANLVGIRLRLTANLSYFRKRILTCRKWGWLPAVFGYCGSQADRFVVAAFAGLGTLGYYSVAVSLASGVAALASVAAGFLLPEAASRAYRRDWLLAAFERATFHLSAWSSAAILALCIASPWLAPLWLGDQRAGEVAPLLIPLLWFSASTITSIPATQFMNAMGHAKLAALIGAWANAATLLALVGAGWAYGLAGVVMAKLVALPLGLAARAVMIHKVFWLHSPLWRALALAWPTFVGAAVALVLFEGAAGL